MVDIHELQKEVHFKTSRSSGAGGQNVNKVETKVTLIWDVNTSVFFSLEQKKLIQERFINRIHSDGTFRLDVSESRSQLANKELAVEKLYVLLTQAIVPKKKRLATKIPRAKILERLDRKKKHATKKENRRWRMD